MSKDFTELFNEWSETYDQTVSGHDVQYKEVFDHYEEILQEVANKVSGNVIEFGVGTGNLTLKLIERGNRVVGIEPSPKMREKALEKLNDLVLLEGDFLNFSIPEKVDAFVSSYAFHHLTDDEKEKAIQIYSTVLRKNGKVVFADTIFADDEAKANRIEWASSNQFLNLKLDLQTEFYTTIPAMTNIFQTNGFDVQFKQMNKFVWIMDATKL